VRKYVVDISLTTQQLKSFYAGQVNQVSARDRFGVRLQFPLQSLRRFVGHEGVRGTFELQVDGQHRLRNIVKIS
jgi:hypothetical protein